MEVETVPEAPDPTELRRCARAVLDAHWQPEGYTVPNLAVYPHQWLWDSCFHAVVWAHLGDGHRAVVELGNLFAHQADDGFVPHLTYWRYPDLHADFWGRRVTSCLTQPPMYGHALAELARLGIAVPAGLVAAAIEGLRFLVRDRMRPDGLVVIVHPWESGCDDSPRWDSWYPGGTWTKAAGFEVKGALAQSVVLAGSGSPGSPVGSDDFEVPSVVFNALVAWNIEELASVATVPADLLVGARTIVDGLVACWDSTIATVTDGGPPARPSGRVRTVEALSAALALPPGHELVPALLDPLHDHGAFGAPFGPTQVHRDESAFDPGVYWRGPSWPQLDYLLWLAERRARRGAEARRLAAATVRGALRSGFAEHWHPDTGAGQGAVPQSWTALAAVMGEA